MQVFDICNDYFLTADIAMMVGKGIRDHFDACYTLRYVVIVCFKSRSMLLPGFYMELYNYSDLTKLALSKNCKASAFAGGENRNLKSLTLNITFKAMSLKIAFCLFSKK